MKDKVVQFRKIVEEMAKLYEEKNSNYGDSFGKLYNDLGATAGLVPLHNKLDRLTNLLKGNANNFESIEDTFIDLANYAIMNLIEWRRSNNVDENKADSLVFEDSRENEVKDNNKKKADSLVDWYTKKDKYSNLPWPCCQCIHRDKRVPYYEYPYYGSPIITCFNQASDAAKIEDFSNNTKQTAHINNSIITLNPCYDCIYNQYVLTWGGTSINNISEYTNASSCIDEYKKDVNSKNKKVMSLLEEEQK